MRDGVNKGTVAPLDMASVGKLQRLRDREQKYKRLQMRATKAGGINGHKTGIGLR